MAGETIVTVVGNLVADPELRFTQNGLPVVNFTVASTPKVFDRQSNEWKDGDALFMRCSAWRDFAEHIAGSLVKGTRVIAQGALKQRSYEDREGNSRTAIELQVDAIGPELRYATAAVSRVSSGGSGRQKSTDWDAASPGGQQARRNDEVWAVPAADKKPTYGDDTPF